MNEFPLEPKDIAETHPLRFSAVHEYFHTYVTPIRQALVAAGYRLTAPEVPVNRYMGKFTVYGEQVVAKWDYSDEMGIDNTGGIGFDGVDLVFKMKCHPERVGAEHLGDGEYRYPDCPVPVFPGGFVLAVGAGHGDTIRWMRDTLPELRREKDEEEQRNEYMARFGFRLARVPLPQRSEFQQLDRWNNLRVPVEQYHRELAGYRFFLNLCGNGNSVDRKVIEAMAIGVCMITTPGLADMRWPFNEKLCEGEHYLPIEHPDEIDGIMDSVDSEKWRFMVNSTREFFDNYLAPQALGFWFTTCFERIAARKRRR